ncbi:MAG: hypothetical protein H7239_10075 [Flavobacterium sp.]|nr:hypothetical protein [Flavobacterium sp.]
MKTLEKTDMLKHSIDRYDHYYDSVNNKCSLYLTLTTFLFGGIITGYYTIKDDFFCSNSIIVLIWISLTACLVSIFFVIRGIIPYVSKHKAGEKISVLNYSCVASISNKEFETAYEEMSKSKQMNDYLNQVHLLAKGLHKKFSYLRTASYFLIVVFICITIIGIKIL